MNPTPADRRPLWWGERDQSPQTPAASATLPRAADVLVVGAGLTGLATALRLAQAGRTPLMVEARRVGAGSTGHSSAKLSLLQGSMLQRLRAHVGVETTAAYVEANRVGQAWLLELLREHDVPHEIRDAITYAVSAQGAKRVAKERDASREAGLDITDVPDHGLPFEVRDAIGLAGQVQIDPLATLWMLRAQLEWLGGRVIEGVRVTGASTSAPWTVQTTGGELRTEHLVLATQAPILDRGLHFARIQAHRSYVLAYEADLAAVPTPMALSLDDPARSLRTATAPDGTTYLLVGGNGHRVGAKVSTVDKVAELDAWARRHFPVGEPAWSWAAQDYHLTTQLPHMGPVPGTGGGILVATGFDKWGMANAATAAHLLTGDITGERPAFAEALRSTRPALRDVTDTLANVAGVGAHIVGDRVMAAVRRADDDTPAEGEGRLEGNPAAPTAVSTVDGRTCRVSGICTHLGGVLAWNDVERSWDCPLHGSRFAADGTLIEGMATSDLERKEP